MKQRKKNYKANTKYKKKETKKNEKIRAASYDNDGKREITYYAGSATILCH